MGIEVNLNSKWELTVNGQEVLGVMVDKSKRTRNGLAAWVATDAGNYLFEMSNSFFDGFENGFDGQSLAVNFAVDWIDVISFENYNL